MELKTLSIPFVVVLVSACIGLAISQAIEIYKEVEELKKEVEAHKEAYDFIETWKRAV